MEEHEVIVVGGGISGLSLAHFCRADGRDTCVLERAPRLGGALHTERYGRDFWLELGGHTTYNSYGRLLGIVEALGLLPRLLPRETARWALWEAGRVVSIPARLRWGELAVSLPRALWARRAGASVADYYSRVVGRANYARVVGPMLSAVVSQDAGGIPAELLFKKRPRRKELPRSFVVQGGLETIAEAIGGQAGLTVHRDSPVAAVARESAAWRVTLDDGRTLAARVLALATPADEAAALLAQAAPEAAALLGRIAVRRLQSEGVVVRRERVALPRLAGLVGLGVPFWSVVTRDPVSHPDFRAFAFHFRPDVPEAERLERITAVLGVPAQALEHRVQATRQLPAPAAGHAALVTGLDARLAGQPLLVGGNYFGGLAIEDCVARSAAEAERLRALPG